MQDCFGVAFNVACFIAREGFANASAVAEEKSPYMCYTCAVLFGPINLSVSRFVSFKKVCIFY